MTKRAVVYGSLLVGCLIFGTDRLLKGWILTLDTSTGTLGTIPMVFNKGIAFGLIGQWGGAVAFVGLCGIAILFIVCAYKSFDWRALPLVLCSVIFFAGCSNLVDRLAFGAVLDFMKLPLWPYAFNIADVALTASCILLFIDMLRHARLSSTRTASLSYKVD